MLAHDERHLRRKVIDARRMATSVLVDLPEPLVARAIGDVLVLDDGRHAEVIAADEELLRDPRPRRASILPSSPGTSATAISPRAIEAERILILRDHVIKAMLEGLGRRR